MFLDSDTSKVVLSSPTSVATERWLPLGYRNRSPPPPPLHSTCPTKTDGSISPSGIPLVIDFTVSKRDLPVSMVAGRFHQSFNPLPPFTIRTHSSTSSSRSILQERPSSFPPRTRLTSSPSLSVLVKSPFRSSLSSTPHLKFSSRRSDVLHSGLQIVY